MSDDLLISLADTSAGSFSGRSCVAGEECERSGPKLEANHRPRRLLDRGTSNLGPDPS